VTAVFRIALACVLALDLVVVPGTLSRRVPMIPAAGVEARAGAADGRPVVLERVSASRFRLGAAGAAGASALAGSTRLATSPASIELTVPPESWLVVAGPVAAVRVDGREVVLARTGRDLDGHHMVPLGDARRATVEGVAAGGEVGVVSVAAAAAAGAAGPRAAAADPGTGPGLLERARRAAPGSWPLGAVVLAATLAAVGATFVPGTRVRSAEVALLVFGLALLIASLAVRQKHPGEPGRELETQVLRAAREGGNLGEVFAHVSGLASGRPFLPRHRMPGYTLFVAAVGLATGTGGDAGRLGLAVVGAQLGLHALSLAILAACAARCLPLPAVALAAGAMCWLPTQVDHTQVDTLVPVAGVAILAALCARHAAAPTAPQAPRAVPEHPPGLGPDLAVHAGFAAYFLLRPDILPAWLGVSLALHARARAWRRLALPAALFAAIGMSWGLYKVRHGEAFVMTTSSAAIGVWAGLWQAPDHRFRFECSDESAFAWVKKHGFANYDDPRAQGFIRAEVLRFYATYPVYVLSLVVHKARHFFRHQNGMGTGWRPFCRPLVGVLALGGKWLLVVVALLALACGHERARTLALVWPVLLVQPIFFLLYDSGGRFVYFVNMAILAAGVPLAVDAGFWRRIAGRRAVALPVAAAGLALLVGVGPVDRFLAEHEGVRCWAPLLDPAHFASWMR
jgi:hypothetical protein